MLGEKELKVLLGNKISWNEGSLQYVGPAEVTSTIECNADEVFVGVVCGGSIKFSTRDKEYKVSRNMMFAYRGDSVNVVKCSKAFKGYFLMVKTKFITDMKVDTSDYIITDMIAYSKPVFQLDDSQAEVINSLAEHIMTLSQAEDLLLRDRIIESLAQAYIYALVSAVGNKSIEDMPTRRNSSTVVLNKFYDLLKEHYQRERSVDFYASQLGVTSKYLSIVCSKYRGVTASRIIDGAVIRHAKMLLKQHGVSVQDVATMLNFPLQSFFGKYFKQRVGVSPSRYKGGN
jgi:AraC-like DNA-binding protein